MPVCTFYLVLRGLDTIEDDMTIDIKVKEPLLRKFHENMEKPGWNFKDSGPDERDRELLVRFDEVIVELQKIKKPYYDVIRDICIQMGNGMADYALNAEQNANGVNTVEDYELYCHYVAGLVGDGLTRLFVESKLANPALLNRPELTEAMGQFLQKTNIIRDIREDWDDKRRFWPKEVWSKHVDKFEDLFAPEYREKALHCQSEMVLNALKHADQCLFYMAGIRDQSVFNFVAIPQSMAIATIELLFRNPDMFDRNVKITKGDACKLMTQSTQNLRVVCTVFRQYVRKIHKKNEPTDPNYLAINIQCGKVGIFLSLSERQSTIRLTTASQIEQFIETLYPSQNVKLLQAGQKQRDGEATMDTMEAVWLIVAILVVFAIIGGLMASFFSSYPLPILS